MTAASLCTVDTVVEHIPRRLTLCFEGARLTLYQHIGLLPDLACPDLLSCPASHSAAISTCTLNISLQLNKPGTVLWALTTTAAPGRTPRAWDVVTLGVSAVFSNVYVFGNVRPSGP